MKRNLTRALTVLLIGVMALTGCGTQGGTNGSNQKKETTQLKEEQVLNFNLGADPKSIDPQLSEASDGNNVINNTFEGLMRERNGQLECAIADSYEVSDDGLVYTFKLKDTKWSDGQPLTAKDFVFAWQRGVNPLNASQYMDIFATAGIKNAEAIVKGEMSPDALGAIALDEKTLEVTLERPTEYFLQLTSFSTFMPVREDIVNQDGSWAKNPQTAVSNGPFKVGEYKMGDTLTLVKNENYWNADNVKLDKIVCYMIVDESTAYTKSTAGELDINEFIPADEVPKLIAENPNFYILPKAGTYYYAFNMNTPTLQDAKVRKALNLAINRKEIVEKVTRGGEIPATAMVPKGIKDADGKDFNEVAGDYDIPLEGNIEEAKALLAQAGYKDGKALGEIEILYNTSETHKLIAEAIQEMWKQNLGVDVVLTNQEWAVFQDTINNNDFKDITRRGWIGDYSDPMTMLEIFESNSAQNVGRYSSEAYDTEIAKAKQTRGKERMDSLYKAQSILMQDLPFIPIYYYVQKYLVSESLEGWEMTSIGKVWFGDAKMVEVEEE